MSDQCDDPACPDALYHPARTPTQQKRLDWPSFEDDCEILRLVRTSAFEAPTNPAVLLRAARNIYLYGHKYHIIKPFTGIKELCDRVIEVIAHSVQHELVG